jgi:hypothetical protein
MHCLPYLTPSAAAYLFFSAPSFPSLYNVISDVFFLNLILSQTLATDAIHPTKPPFLELLTTLDCTSHPSRSITGFLVFGTCTKPSP